MIDLGRNSMWCDELYTVWVSRLPADSYFTALSSWGHPPTYYLLGRIWFIFSTSDAWSRSISSASGVVLIFLVFLVGKELFSRQIGLWGASLAALSPFLVSYSRDATYYSWLASLSLLSFYLLIRSVMRGGWLNWALFTAISIITISSHLFSFILLPAFAGVYLILRDRERESLAPFVISQLTLTVTFFVSWLISHNANGLIDFKFPLKTIIVKLALIPYVLLGGGFNDFGAGIGGTIIRNVRPGRPLVLAAILLFLVILPLSIIFLRRKTLIRTFLSKRAVALAYYSVVLSVIPVIIHNVIDIPDQPSQRFYLWSAPTFLLLLALAIVSLSARGKVIMGAILITGFSALSLWGVFFYHPLDFKTPLTFVSNSYQSGDLLFCTPYEIAFMASGHYYPDNLKMGGTILHVKGQRLEDYYYLSDNSEVSALMTNNYKEFDERYLTAGEDLKRRIQGSIRSADRVWVIAYFDYDHHEHCVGCEVMDSAFADGWQEEIWPFDSGNVYLYSRKHA